MFITRTCYMSRDVRKPDFCICENKDAYQLRGNREADQRLCFRYTDSFVSDLVGNPEDRFSDVAAYINVYNQKSYPSCSPV